jgi:TRAP-type uncharacterized transport system substrate-binding protein
MQPRLMTSNPSALIKATTLVTVFNLLSMFGCSEKKDLTIISDLELGETITDHPTVSSLRKAVSEVGVTLDFKNTTIEKEADIIQLINAKKIDIGIVKNDVEMGSGYANVRTLIPLFPDVLLILSKNDSISSIESLFVHNRAAVILDKEEEMAVIERFLKKNGTAPSSIGTIHASDTDGITEALNEYDVLILFASLNSPSVRSILQSWKGTIFSLDDPALIGKGSIVDGFCMAYPKAVPYIVPKGIYGQWPLKPILTFAVFDVLVCHKDLDPHLAYDMVQSIYNHRQSLSEENFEFGMLDDNIESHKFSFPLHEGAIKYVTRDQPTFWERESEVMGLLISLLVLTTGGLTTLFKYLKQRRKDRVDIYYQKVLFTVNHARDTRDLEKKKKYLSELFLIRNNAFEQLIAERLDANEAFTIFVNLLNGAIHELEGDIRSFEKEQQVSASESL